MNLTGEEIYGVALIVWAVATIVAFVGGAWLMAQLRGEDDLMLADQLAKKQIDIDEYRARATLIQP